ncbi:autotransporter-associated beta strand repeat-containing protein, partial [Phytopseudomonas argentinensis]
MLIVPGKKTFPYKKFLLGTFATLNGAFPSDASYAMGSGGAGFSTAGSGGRGDGQSGGGGYYSAWDNRMEGSEGNGAQGGQGFVASGGAGGRVGIQLNTSAPMLDSFTGQNGTVGGNTVDSQGAGGGGAGGAAVFLSGNQRSVILAPTAQLMGGNGGNGGEGSLAAGGGGGGGTGLLGTGDGAYIQIGANARLSGGNGGIGGNSRNIGESSGSGGGGGGGSGLNLRGSGNIVEVWGQVRGGNGGAAGTTSDGTRLGLAGQGGAGVRLQGNGNQLTVSGSITGGLNATNSQRADAVRLIGDNNRLELQAGYAFTGNVAATGTGNTLVLGGSNQASLDVSKIGSQLQNFSSFEKTGSSTWTLTGIPTANRNWNVLGGTLIASTASLGNGNVANNAALAFNQTSSGIYSGTVSGTGSLVKAGSGTLTLLANNSYTGGTTLQEGVLQIGNGGNTGSVAGNILNNATLSFNR